MSVNSRISEFFELKKIRQSELVKRGYGSKQTVSFIFNGKQSPNYKFLQSMIKDYPELNHRWLLLDEGEMFNQDSEKLGIEEVGSVYNEKSLTKRIVELEGEVKKLNSKMMAIFTILKINDTLEKLIEKDTEIEP